MKNNDSITLLATTVAALATGATAQVVPAVRVVPATGVPLKVIEQAMQESTQAADDSGGDLAPPPDAAMAGMAVAAAGTGAVPTPFPPEEVEELKKLFASLEEPEQAEDGAAEDRVAGDVVHCALDRSVAVAVGPSGEEEAAAEVGHEG